MDRLQFILSFEEAQKEIHKTAVEHGWWEKPREAGTTMMLMVTELAEAFEGLRHGDPPSDHIPEFTSQEEELADTIIRIADYAAHHNLRLAEAILAKMEFNKTRPYRHGNKAF